jgi:hypothetical protein
MMFGNNVLRAISAHKMQEAQCDAEHHTEELYNMCSSPNIIRVLKTRNTRWARYVARRGAMNKYIQILSSKTCV